MPDERIPILPMPIRAVTGPLPDDVLSFLETTVSPRGREHWAWKYARTSKESPAAFYWEDDGGQILGFLGLMRTRLIDGLNRAHDAAWFVDWHAAPGTASGVGIALLRKAEASAGILLTLQGTAYTRSILPRLGWHEARRAATWVRPLSGHFLASYLRQHAPAPLRGLASVAEAAGPLLRLAPHPFRSDTTVRDSANALAEIVDQVFSRHGHEFEPLLGRDQEYVQHFCSEFPEGGYRVLAARSGHGTEGYAIWRIDRDRHGLRRGRLVDLLWRRRDLDLGESLVREACREMQQAGADYVECVASVEDLEDILRHLRFRVRQPVSLWYHRLPAEALPARWYITLLDCDRAYR